MAWIESHQSLGVHIKLRRLARALGIHRAQAIGHLHYLWWWALDGAPTGDLSGLQPAEIAELAEWPGDADQFMAALRDCGWLDADGRIHDWHEYAGRLVDERRRDRDRKRLVRRTSAGHTSDGGRTATVPNPTLPNPTQPHPTSVCTHSGGAPASNESAPDLPSRELPSLEAVLARAQQIGLAEWKARDWFNEMEGCGWKDYAGRDIRRWEAVLQRVAVKWRADGSPSSPPARNPEPGTRIPNRRAPIDWSKGFFGDQTPKPTST